MQTSDFVYLILIWLITVRCMCGPKRAKYHCKRARTRGLNQKVIK